MEKEKILNLPLIMCNQKMCIKWNSKISGIYAWFNDINGKMYIGQTVNFYKRIYDEMNGFRHHKHQNLLKLFNAIEKYGMENFRVIRLMECPKEYLTRIEMLLIEYYDSKENGYNCTIGGDGTGGHVVSTEQVKKQRVALKQYWTDEKKQEQSEKMRAWFNSKSKDEQKKMRSGNGWWLDTECKERHLQSTRNSLTPERIENQRKSLRKFYEENGSKKAMTMNIISPKNEIIKINGLENFCREYRMETKGIKNMLDGIKKHHRGWHIDPSFIWISKPPKQLLSPRGKLYEFQSIIKFCEEQGLDCGGVKSILSGKSKHYKLWRLPSISLEEAVNNKNFIYKNVAFKFPDNHVEKVLDRKKFCGQYGYSQKYLYKFLKNKSVGDMFHELKLISK